MNKLMIAAAAAMAGATTFGGLCDPDAVGPDSCSVYNIKFTFKTLAPKTACAQGAKWLVSSFAPGTEGVFGAKWYRNAAADTAAAGDPATDGATVTVADYVATGLDVCNFNPAVNVIANAAFRQVFWMDNATRKFEGIAWQCKAACFEGFAFNDCDPNNNGRLNYVIWEKKNSLAISFPVFQVKYGADDGANFTGTPQTTYFSLDAQWDMLIGRYGKKAQKVTAYWQLWNLLHGQSIDAAGFGTYDVKNLRTKSVSGNAVGMLMPVGGVTDPCGNKDRIFCALGFMCVEWMDWCCDGCYAGVDLVPASGTWSLKYNSSATKKANKDKATLSSFVPAYMFYSHSAWAAAKAADPWLHADNYYWWGSTTGALIYKEGGAAGVTDDDILDYLALGGCNVINVVFDGVKSVADGETKYTYFDTAAGEAKEFTLENGVLPTDVFDLNNPAPAKE